MNLKNFLATTLENESQAIKVFDNLVQTLSVNQKNENALLDFFQAIPHTLKENKKTTEYMLYVFFNKYHINENNVKYYYDYIQENYMKNSIIDKNPDWKFSQTIFQYNTLKDLLVNFELAKVSLSGEFEQSDKAGLKFIEDNFDSFVKFSKNGNKKFVNYLIKKNVFKFIQEIDYHKFKDFCEKLNLNSLDIMYDMYIKPYSEYTEGYGIKGFFSHTKYRNFTHNELVSVLNDITENRQVLFGDKNQFFNIKENEKNENHVSILFMDFIREEKYDFALTLKKYFNSEIIEGLNHFQYGYKPIVQNEINIHLLDSVMKKLYDLSQRDGAFHYFSRLNKNHLGQFINYENQHKSVNKNKL